VAPVALLAAVTSVLWILSDSGVLDGSHASHPATTSKTHHQARRAARSRTHAASSLTASGAASTGGGAGGATTRIYYRVQAGDTLASIAQRAHLTVAQLQQLNPTVTATNLQIGEQLTLR
jgi:LysM repeat protein